AVDGSPSLARLVPTATAAAHPSELARLGVEPGDRVRVASPSGETTLAVSADAGVPKGVLAVDFNLSSDDRTVANAAALLIAADALVNEVRLESR
ncbi:MAG: molybdopterin dinucleotide binding domain-containing protein, partial [Acidimicrobiales bacterium]